MRINYTFIFILILTISALAIRFVIQNYNNNNKVSKQDEYLKAGSCYKMNDDSSSHAIKIIKVADKNAYIERTWTKSRGWDDEAISERTSHFYSEIKCPSM